MRHTVNLIRRLGTLTLLLALAGCADTKQPVLAKLVGEGEERPVAEALPGSRPVVARGSIVDGPVDNRTIAVLNRKGQLRTRLLEDGSGNFQLTTLFPEEDFPLLLQAGEPSPLQVVGDPGFTLLAAIVKPSLDQRVSLNAYATLITKVAQRLPRGLTPSNLETARRHVLANLDFGLYGAFRDDPLTTLTDADNVHVVVKGCEALAETIRRASERLNLAGHHTTADDVLDSLAADLTDGHLDGTGTPGAHPRVAAVAAFVAGQVALEALVNEIRGGGRDATASLDYLIARQFPSTAVRTRNVHLTEALIERARVGIEIAHRMRPNRETSEAARALARLTPFMRPDRARKILPAALPRTLDHVAHRIATSSPVIIERINTLAAATALPRRG